MPASVLSVVFTGGFAPARVGGGCWKPPLAPRDGSMAPIYRRGVAWLVGGMKGDAENRVTCCAIHV